MKIRSELINNVLKYNEEDIEVLSLVLRELSKTITDEFSSYCYTVGVMLYNGLAEYFRDGDNFNLIFNQLIKEGLDCIKIIEEDYKWIENEERVVNVTKTWSGWIKK